MIKSPVVSLSLLPVGLARTWASVEHGYWRARSPELLQVLVLRVFGRARVPGDLLLTVGILSLVMFIAGLPLGFSYEKEPQASGKLAPVQR